MSSYTPKSPTPIRTASLSKASLRVPRLKACKIVVAFLTVRVIFWHHKYPCHKHARTSLSVLTWHPDIPHIMESLFVSVETWDLLKCTRSLSHPIPSGPPTKPVSWDSWSRSRGAAGPSCGRGSRASWWWQRVPVVLVGRPMGRAAWLLLGLVMAEIIIPLNSKLIVRTSSTATNWTFRATSAKIPN